MTSNTHQLPLPLSEDQRDCLQEIANVAMGAAGESLAGLTKSFVELSIPVIRAIRPAQIPMALRSLANGDEGGQETGKKVSAVAQAFRTSATDGYALVVITEPSFNDLARASGRNIDSDAVAAELLLELASTINNTCLPGLAETLESAVEIDDPEVLSLHVDLADLHFDTISTWERAVSVEINYHLEQHPFNCDLLLLYPEAAIDNLRQALDRLLED